MQRASTARRAHSFHTSRRKAPRPRPAFKTGDIVVSVDGKEVSDPNAFQYRFTTKGTSGEVSLEVLRGGTRRKLTIPLMVAAETPPPTRSALQAAIP